jgi:hypothetical protein
MGSHNSYNFLSQFRMQLIAMEIIIIIIIFLHGLGRLTCSAIDALPSFPRASTISSSSRFVVSTLCWSGERGGGLACLKDLTGNADGNFVFGRTSQAEQTLREKPD